MLCCPRRRPNADLQGCPVAHRFRKACARFEHSRRGRRICQTANTTLAADGRQTVMVARCCQISSFVVGRYCSVPQRLYGRHEGNLGIMEREDPCFWGLTARKITPPNRNQQQMVTTRKRKCGFHASTLLQSTPACMQTQPRANNIFRKRCQIGKRERDVQAENVFDLSYRSETTATGQNSVSGC